MPHHPDPKVSKRLFRFCPIFNKYNTAGHIDCCDFCSRFFARCCHHPDIVCHYHCFVFVDGACARNGQPDARAGIGCALGTREEDQVSLTVTDAMDRGGRRTSQRAELLAALHSLDLVVGAKLQYHVGSRAHLKSADTEREYVIVSDSEYVVKGMTEWVPEWKKNNWKTKQGRPPANADLFSRLDNAVTEYENNGLKIQFLHVERELNSIADNLAKRATDEPLLTM
ncbi:ribonuclease H-like domain-containing protein [Mycena leptocephala]|nr:ribonuclease H-like domain-containing protein [Mycena leptocephala]